MPRVAGDSDHYELAIIDSTGNPVGRSIYLPSVTSILKALPKNGLDWYGYKMGLIEGRKVLAQATVPSAPMSDDDFYEHVKKLGREGKAITPYTALKSAGQRGTDAHDLAETVGKALFETGKMPQVVIPSDLTGYINALLAFFNERVKNKLKVVAVEIPVFSMMNQYAGTLDLILHDEEANIYYVVDWKTSKAIYESHLLQIVAYLHAAREQGWIPPEAAAIATVVRLGEDGKYEMKNSECELEQFMHVYRVWQWLNAMKGE